MKPKKKTKLEISSGGVVFKKLKIKNEKLKIKILLIKDSYGRWALPKGKIEKGEKPEEAALREIQEETGLADLKIIKHLGQIKYFYQIHGQPIFKIVYNFLIETEQKELKPNYEIQDAHWFEPEDALKTIAYKNTKEILEKAVDKLKGLCEITS
jgi:8-oxo-dGTP pyrophosphatase MutT (NUDIX family)